MWRYLMKADWILTEPFLFHSYQELNIMKEVNNHAFAFICGILIENTDSDILENLSPDEILTIKACSLEGEETILFRGIISKISLKAEDGIKLLKVWAYSHTYLMDKKKKTRIFQDTNQTFWNITKYVGKENQARVIGTEGKEEKTGKMVVQYQETDWEFLKRMASHLHTVIVSDCLNGKISFSLGPVKPKKAEIHDYTFETIRNIKQSDSSINSESENYIKEGACVYFVKTREILELCAPVSFCGKECIICKTESFLQEMEIVNTYKLIEIKELKTSLRYNYKMIGLSLEGNVKKVDQDRLQISFSKDVDVPCVWFPYATVYSSPDGTGWYCMPEIGDNVRVYFPDFNEKNAIAINSIHLTCNFHENPDIKYIRSSHEKEIRFEPSAIRITNNKGLSVVLDDKEGILLESDSDILARSEGNIEIDSGKELRITGNQGVVIRQGDNKIEVKDGIRQNAKTILQK